MTYLNSLAMTFCLAILLNFGTSYAAETQYHWVDSWSAAPDQSGPIISNATLRQIVRSTVDGKAIRIRLSNLYGSKPVTFGSAHVALHEQGPAIQTGSDHALTFHGKSTVTIANGESVLSDPLTMSVAVMQEIVVSLYLPKQAGTSTLHGVGLESSYLKSGVDASGTLNLSDAKAVYSRYFLTDVEVAADDNASAIAVFGASIEDGVDSSMDARSRWTDVLAERLHRNAGTQTIAVLNEGVAGNRLLQGADEPFRGQSALMRFDRDALQKPGVRWIILDIGINDIGAASLLATRKARAPTQQIIEGLKNLIAQAHVRGIKIIGTTMPPFADADFGPVPHPYYSAQGETQRQEINNWMRKAHPFDAIIDFDQILRDPSRPDHLLPMYDSGDHLHPNDVGHKALADAIDLNLILPHSGISNR